MATVNHFEDLEVWQRARPLTAKIYTLARQGEFAKDFGFRDQICRAAVSIVSNIAEGFERRSNRQFQQFLDIANGSAGELRAQLYVALDLGYVTPAQFKTHSPTSSPSAKCSPPSSATSAPINPLTPPNHLTT